MTVVVLHGFTGCGAAMASLAERLGGDVVTPDLAGHETPLRSAPDDCRVDAMAERVVQDWSGPLDLVGYSMGGRVALTVACRFPERVRSLSLIGASAGIADPEQRHQRTVDDEDLAQRIESDFEGFVDDWMAHPLFASQANLGQDFLGQARRQRLDRDPAGLAMSLRHGGTGQMAPLHDLLDRCVMPTALIAGAYDGKFCAIAAELAAAIPSADVHVIDAAGHAAHVEQPDAVAAVVNAVMSSQ